MPTIVAILRFMSRTNFMLSWVEHEQSFITSGRRRRPSSNIFRTRCPVSAYRTSGPLVTYLAQMCPIIQNFHLSSFPPFALKFKFASKLCMHLSIDMRRLVSLWMPKHWRFWCYGLAEDKPGIHLRPVSLWWCGAARLPNGNRKTGEWLLRDNTI